MAGKQQEAAISPTHKLLVFLNPEWNVPSSILRIGATEFLHHTGSYDLNCMSVSLVPKALNHLYTASSHYDFV